MKITCCRDCPDRFQACHDRCEVYQAEKAKAQEAKKREEAYELVESTIAKQKQTIWMRMQRSHRR